MKKALQYLGKGIVYIIAYYILAAFLGIVLPGTEDADGVKHLSGFASFINLIAPALTIWLFAGLIKKKGPHKEVLKDTTEKQITVNERVEKLPSAKKCKEIAESLKVKAKNKMQYAYGCSSITMFVYYGLEVNRYLEEAKKYEEKAGYSFYEKPSELLKQFEDEYQWKLRDAIEREEQKLIGEIKGPQHNNKRACCQKYYDEIEKNIGRFSEETLQYAMNTYYRLLSVAGLSVQTGKENNSTNPLDLVDNMEGHEFEFFCADLLTKNGFTNVEVTRGSGDQGIDILAEKDDIKYAIQCKCYSSDLGNKPVQEAFAGKSIYNCQIAAVLTNRYFTQGGIEAAKATGVLLWDRRKLQSFIENANT